MSDFIKVDASKIEEFQKKLARWVKIAPKEVARVLTVGAEMVRREAQEHHLNGPKMPRGVGSEMNATLGRVSSRLFQSIAIKVLSDPNTGRFSAQVGTRVPYGRLHEFGGKIDVQSRGQLAHAVSGKFVSGKWAARKKNRGAFLNYRLLGSHTVNIPARPFLRPSLLTKRPKVFEMIGKEFMKSYGK